MNSLGFFVENGIAQVKELITEKITTKKLCIEEDGEEVCIDKNQLKELLEIKLNQSSLGGSSDGNCQPSEEICDSLDNDCDGLIDEDNVCQAECQAQTFYYDGDGDGFGNYGNFISVCEAPAGYVSDNTDCDDGDPSINPVASEICDDGIDNDCDGEVDAEDEDCQAAPPTPVCDSEHLDLCETEADCLTAEGYWYNEGCNTEPEAPACTPAEEICDGLDNDCDGQIDEDLGKTTCGVGACEVTIDNCIDGVVQTCTPGTPTTETCNGIDEDCDGLIDEELTQQCGSSDVGACQLGTQICEVGAWGECIGAIEPAEEICNDNIDNNCNGQIDEGCQTQNATPTEDTATSTSDGNS